MSPACKAVAAAYYIANRPALLERAHIRKGFQSSYWTAGTCRWEHCDELLRSDNSSGLCKYHRKLEWARRNYSASKAARRRQKLTYGIELEGKRALLLAQGGCAICRKPPTDNLRGWHTDHNHSTGAVRGVLCLNCNSGLGQFHDDPVALQAAIDYLRSHP